MMILIPFHPCSRRRGTVAGGPAFLADGLVLKNYMTRLLEERNSVIKLYAESGKGEALLKRI